MSDAPSVDDPDLNGPVPGTADMTGDELSDAAIQEEDDAAVGRAVWFSLLGLSAAALVGGGIYGAIVLANREVLEPAPEIERVDVRGAVESELPSIQWADVTAAAGVDFFHESGATGDKLLPETMVGGCAFFDYDGDGDPDLLLVGGKGWDGESNSGSARSLALYQNDGTGQFADVTAAAGLDASLYGMGAATGDYDGDGDLDLYVTVLGPNRLYRNDGGAFVDVTADFDVAGGENDWSTSAGWFDHDRDGDLDLIVLNYLSWSRENDVAQDFRLTGGSRAYGRPMNFPGARPYLFRNDGDAGFTDVAEEAGLVITNPDTGVAAMKSLGLGIADFNGDGWSDLLVANDTVRNCFFVNAQDGSFREEAVISGVAYDDAGKARGAMGVDVARFRGDGTLGVAIGNFSNEMTALYADPFGDMQFTDEAVASGLGPQTRLMLTFGVLWLDADLDGRQDLFCANGHLEQEIALVQESQTYEQPPQLFWNAGDEGETEFVPLNAEQLGEEFLAPMVGRGAAAADIDLDGDVDLLIAATGAAPRLLRNDQSLGRHWVRVDLGPGGEGADVTLVSGGKTQRRTVTSCRGYLSASELPLTFGLGEAESVDSLTVTWPDGTTQDVDVGAVDTVVTVTPDGP